MDASLHSFRRLRAKDVNVQRLSRTYGFPLPLECDLARSGFCFRQRVMGKLSTPRIGGQVAHGPGTPHTRLVRRHLIKRKRRWTEGYR